MYVNRRYKNVKCIFIDENSPEYLIINICIKQMVLYIEACESGSMFDKILPNNINGILGFDKKNNESQVI